MVDIDLDAIQARADAATPGPWEHRHERWQPDHQIRAANGDEVAGNHDPEAGGIVEPADTEFIAHARADIPALVAEVRRLTTALKAIRDEDMATAYDYAAVLDLADSPDAVVIAAAALRGSRRG